MEKRLYISVILPLKLEWEPCYFVRVSAQIGQRVRVNFSGKEYIGVISGVGLAQLISAVMEIPVAIDGAAIVISVVFSTLIGVVFGLLPATQAANLNPIDALRRN